MKVLHDANLCVLLRHLKTIFNVLCDGDATGGIISVNQRQYQRE